MTSILFINFKISYQLLFSCFKDKNLENPIRKGFPNQALKFLSGNFKGIMSNK